MQYVVPSCIVCKPPPVRPPALLQSAPSDLAAYGVKERLVGRWREVAAPSPAAAANGAANGAGGGSGKGGKKGSGKGGRSSCGDFVSEEQRALFALLNCYSDMLLPCRPYPASKDPGVGGRCCIARRLRFG